MSWQRKIDELHKRSEMADQMGGKEKTARQHEFGKLTIRERVAAIVDSDSFHEIGKIDAFVQSDMARIK